MKPAALTQQTTVARVRWRARGLRLNLIIVRIMRRNTITCDRYQLLCRLRRSQIVTIATAAHRHQPPPTATNRHPVPRSCLYCRFYSDCNSGIIDRRRCEIRKPTARFIALSPPPPPLLLSPALSPRLATSADGVLRSAINTLRYRRRDDIRPRSGIAPDKSQRCFVFLFLPFFSSTAFAR